MIESTGWLLCWRPSPLRGEGGAAVTPVFLEKWAGQKALPQKGTGDKCQPPPEGWKGQPAVQRKLPSKYQALLLVATCSPCGYAVRRALRAALTQPGSGRRDRCHQPGLTHSQPAETGGPASSPDSDPPVLPAEPQECAGGVSGLRLPERSWGLLPPQGLGPLLAPTPPVWGPADPGPPQRLPHRERPKLASSLS